MKKILLLFPYRFTEYDYYKYEIFKLEKKYSLKVIINDLSNVVTNKKLNDVWKTKLEKKALKFSSLLSWIFYFNKIKKERIIIFNHIQTSNLNSFIINFLIKVSKLPIMFYDEASPFPKTRKNIHFFLYKIKEHGFNYKVYLFYLKLYFFKFLLNLKKYDKIYLLSNNYHKKYYNGLYGSKEKNFVKIDFNSYDYSNALIMKRNKKKNYVKNYIIYLDSGSPYFTGDTHVKGNRIPKYDIKKNYSDLNFFFDKIEKYFNAKVIVIPHPKYRSSNTNKIKSFNPYFNNRIVSNHHDSLAKLSSDCLFFIHHGSTAMSYAIIYYKPVLHIYSSEWPYESGELQSIYNQSKNTGTKPFDISKLNKKKILKSLTVDKLKYKYYKYKYLTPKNKNVEKIPNYKIIGDFMKKNF